MFKWIRNKKAQNTAEYAIVIGLVVAVAIGMQTYIKRGLQGRIADAVNHVGAGADVGGTDLTFSGQQFEPTFRDSSYDTTTDASETMNTALGGAVTKTVDQSTDRTGYETESYP